MHRRCVEGGCIGGVWCVEGGCIGGVWRVGA